MFFIHQKCFTSTLGEDKNIFVRKCSRKRYVAMQKEKYKKYTSVQVSKTMGI
jgi:hypothetical protein